MDEMDDMDDMDEVDKSYFLLTRDTIMDVPTIHRQSVVAKSGRNSGFSCLIASQSRRNRIKSGVNACKFRRIAKALVW